MYKLKSSPEGGDDFSFGFDRDRDRTHYELTDNKILKDKNHARVMLRDVFGFAKHQEKPIYRLG